jgi:hypothetical protein
MHMVTKMVSMAKTPEEIKETELPAVAARVKEDQPIYPWGLSLRLEEKELEKLRMGECEVGDIVHVFAMARVTSKSEHATEGNQNCSIELQITDLSLENENAEVAELPDAQKLKREKWYGTGAESEEA